MAKIIPSGRRCSLLPTMSSSEREGRKLLRCQEDSYCEGFRMPAAWGDAAYTGAGVRKPPRKETAIGEGGGVPGGRYGDLSARAVGANGA